MERNSPAPGHHGREVVRRPPGTSIDRAMIFDLVFSPDGKTFATANKDGTVKIWEVGEPSKSSR